MDNMESDKAVNENRGRVLSDGRMEMVNVTSIKIWRPGNVVDVRLK